MAKHKAMDLCNGIGSRLRHYAKNRKKVMGSIPDQVIGFFN
jgi:hypothetical protein